MIKVLHIDIYNCTIIFALEIDENEWTKFSKNRTKIISQDDNELVIDTIQNESYDGATIMTDQCDFVVFIRDKTNKGTIAHEIFHACNRLLMCRGVTHDELAEPYAYLIGYVTEQFYKMFDKELKG